MKFITFSFDDGTVQDRDTVRLLNKYGLKATFNLNSGLFGNCHNIVQDGRTINHTELTAAEAKELYPGHEIAVHTRTHPKLQELDEAARLEEINGDKSALEELFGCKITGMAYPGGIQNYDQSVVKTLREHTELKYARTILETDGFAVPEDFLEWHPTCHMRNKDIFALADKFVSLDPDEDAIFYIWGHSYNFDAEELWKHVERFFEKAASMKNVKIATNSEVYEYFASKKQKS